MKTNSSAEAALHIVLLLAAAPKGREISSSDLADFHELSRTTLAKVLQQLTVAGVVVGTAGRRGGYRLSRHPDKITVLQVVSAIEGVVPAFHCREIRRLGPCAGRASEYSARCVIARTMDGSTAVWRQHLDQITIGDLARDALDDVSASILEQTAAWLEEHAR